MILILSDEHDSHVPYVTRRLDSLGANYHRFDPSQFPAESEVRIRWTGSGLTGQRLRHRGCEIDLTAVTAVWNRRPGVPQAAAEITDDDQRRWACDESRYCLAGLWETMDCLWIPGKPRDIAAGQNKVTQLALAAELGFHVPRTLITNSPEGLLEFYDECGGRLVTKVLWQGEMRPDGERRIAYTHVVRRRDAAGYRAIRYAPVILQEYVPKRLELRITVVGSRVFAAQIDSQASRRTRHDWRHYDNERATYAPHTLPAEVAALCTGLVRALRLEFSAIDMVLTPSGEYVFLEVNPSGQWGWIEDLTGLPISRAITDLLIHGAATRTTTQ